MACRVCDGASGFPDSIFPVRTSLRDMLAYVDRLLDRSTGEVRSLPAEEIPSILGQIAAYGDPAAVPYLLPFLAHGGAVSSPVSAGILSRMRNWWNVRDEVVTPTPHNPSAVARAAARTIAILVSSVRVTKLVGLDEDVRRIWRWRATELWRAVGDVDALPMDAQHPAAVLGTISFHDVGRVREAAVRRLAALREGDELPFLLLRVNDWVEPIRLLAREAVRQRMRTEHARRFVDCLPLVTRLSGHLRVDHRALVAEIQDFLCSSAAADALRTGWVHADRETRRQAFCLSARGEHPHWDELLATALADHDIMVRLWAAGEVPKRLGGDARDRMLSRMRHDPHLALRTAALEAYLANHPDRAIVELEHALLDTSASVRHLARFHLNKRTGRDDFAEVYRPHLDDARGHVLRAAIAGLGETGTRADAARIEPFVTHRWSKIARMALRVLTQLDPELGREVALEVLRDARPAVSRNAYSLLANHVYSMDEPQLWALVECSPHLHARQAALALLATLPRWQSLPRLLMALNLDEPALRDTARTLLEQWLHSYHRARYAPSRPSQEELNRLSRMLDAPPLALGQELAARFFKIREHWARGGREHVEQ